MSNAYNPPAILRQAYYVRLAAAAEEAARLEARHEVIVIEDDKKEEEEVMYIDLTPPAAPTPPLVIRDEQMVDVFEISQEEFLCSIANWTSTTHLQLRGWTLE